MRLQGWRQRGLLAAITIGLFMVAVPGATGKRATEAVRTAAQTSTIALGAYVADAPGPTDSLANYVTQVGVAPKIVMWFQSWAEPLFYSSQMPNVASVGAIPMITWEPWDGNPNTVAKYAPRNIVRGDFDSYIWASARMAAAYGKPMFIRFAHEMNGWWYPWSIGMNNNTPADYIAMWRHVVSIFRQAGANNVLWVWSPNIIGKYGSFDRFYPGDSWVDWVGLDGYNYPKAPWQSLGQLFGASYSDLSALTNKPMMIAEVSCSEVGGNKAAWIRSGLLQDVPDLLPRVRAVVWFDRDKVAEGEYNWSIDSSPSSLAAFQEVAHSPLYGGSPLTSGNRWLPWPLSRTGSTSIRGARGGGGHFGRRSRRSRHARSRHRRRR